MIGQRFTIPLNLCDSVEGIVIKYDEDSGKVVLMSDDGEKLEGYEYQLEDASEQLIIHKSISTNQ